MANHVLQLTRVEEGAIELDGLLSDTAWQAAQRISDFTQREPVDGQPASERTEIRALYSDHALYIGVIAYDSVPAEIRSELSRRDQSSQSDEITIFIDSYHDRRTAFEFTVNPRGSIRDVYYFGDSQDRSNTSWDPVWEVRTAKTDEGWSAEFRIPLTQLRFESENSSWGFQVRRRIERKAEEDWWAPYRKDASGFVSHFGTLEGFSNLPSPKRFEVRPYTVFNNRYRPSSSGSLFSPRRQFDLNGGIDIKYGISSDFTLDFTLNPDFGQVEADPSVVNLSAFESFFPEKRPFFIEGSGLFSAGLPLGQLFYSRRIGRPPQGFAAAPPGGTVEIPEATAILGAAKITGKSASGLGLGILSALTAEEKAVLRNGVEESVGRETVEPLTHYFAARVEQDFEKGSHTVGAFATAVNRDLSNDFGFLRSSAYALELDGVHRWESNAYAIRWQVAGSHLRGSQQAMITAQRSSLHYYQRPDASDVQVDSSRTTLSGYSLRLYAGKEAGSWQLNSAYEHVSPGFDASDLGFQRGVAGLHYAEVNNRFLQTQPQWVFKNFSVMTNAAGQWTSAGDRTFNWIRPVFFRGSFTNNWSIAFTPFAFGDWNSFSHTLLRGGPHVRQDPWRNSWVEITTDRRLPIALELWLESGGNFGTRGEWYDYSPTILIRPSPQFNLSFSAFYWWSRDPSQWVRRVTALDTTRSILAELNQRTLRLTARINWILSPVLSVEFYAQPFVSAGAYSEYKEVTNPRAKEFNDRFRFYKDELSCDADGNCAVDLNKDGTQDFSIGNPNFNFRQLRSTLVLRWEYRPGSVFFFAWQHGRQRFLPTGAFGGFGDIGDLFSEDSDNTILVKFNYWFSL